MVEVFNDQILVTAELGLAPAAEASNAQHGRAEVEAAFNAPIDQVVLVKTVVEFDPIDLDDRARTAAVFDQTGRDGLARMAAAYDRIGQDDLATTRAHRVPDKAEAANNGAPATAFRIVLAGVPAIGQIIGPIEFRIAIVGTIGESTIAPTSGTTGTRTGTTTTTGMAAIGGIVTTFTIRTIPISTIGVGLRGRR